MSNGWFDEDEQVCPQCGFHDQHYRSWRRPGEPLVTVIAFWPVSERDHMDYDDRWISRCYYRTACAHAHWDLQIVEEPGQTIIPEGIPTIGLESPNPIEERPHPDPDYRHPTVEPGPDIMELAAFDHPINATYIIGNTHFERPSDHFTVDYKLGVSMDDPEIAAYSPFYGSQVVPLIWYDRKLKGL